MNPGAVQAQERRDEQFRIFGAPDRIDKLQALSDAQEPRLRGTAEATSPLDDHTTGPGWPGDGSGLDDLADHNQNESDDYRNE